MKTNTEYKNDALSAMKGNWAPSVLAVLAYVGIVLLLFLPVELKAAIVGDDLTDLSAAKGLMTLLMVYLVGLFLIGGPLYVGLVNSFKMLLSSGDNRLTENEFKVGFGNWLHHVWGFLLKNIFIMLWSCLFYIPGIIKGLSYAMTNYILADYPELSANKAINLSKEMMYGHKYDLFYLYLGFAGWLLLGILTLGIGMFWFIPYVQTAQASFYQDVKAEWEARHTIG